ncbi:MAG: ABC transporter permease [Planctomycetes bacterium]|nr:ABC transporter permease [Planctomycetota bacterium]
MDHAATGQGLALGEAAPTPAAVPGAGPGLRLDSLAVTLGSDVLRLQAPLTLRAGRLYLLYGPSGSGKSSFVRALLGLGELAAPRVAARGQAVLRDAAGVEHELWAGDRYNPAARAQIAFLPQAEKLGFLDGLDTLENLRLFSRLARAEAETHAQRLAARFHLMGLPKVLARASGGERMRLSAVRALMPRDGTGGPPALVIADEPTSGLDAAAARGLARELVDLAARGDSVVVVITHDPQVFTGQTAPETDRAASARSVRVLECAPGPDGAAPVVTEPGRLKLEAGPPRNALWARVQSAAQEGLGLLGGVVLAPLAFLWGLAGTRRPWLSARRVLADWLDPATQVFAWLGCLLVGGMVSYFIFEQMPRKELIEPLVLEEILALCGHTLVRVVLPLVAAGLVAGKLGAAQSARLSAGVRGGLLETLALARWPAEGFGLVPAVLAQTLAIALATALALAGGVTLAALVYVATHDGASLGLALDLMTDSLRHAPHWKEFLVAKVLVSGFLGGSMAALFGLSPAVSEDDVARAVRRTLLWGVLAVIAAQCLLVVWEFTP